MPVIFAWAKPPHPTRRRQQPERPTELINSAEVFATQGRALQQLNEMYYKGKLIVYWRKLMINNLRDMKIQ